MKSIWTITKRELAGYFNSPVAYVFLVIFLAIRLVHVLKFLSKTLTH